MRHDDEMNTMPLHNGVTAMSKVHPCESPASSPRMASSPRKRGSAALLRLGSVLAVLAIVGTTATGALAQVTTRLVTAGGSATTATVVPGASTSIDVRIDAPATQTIGAAFTLSQTAPGSSGYISITGRSFAGSIYDDTASGTPDGTVLAPAAALLDPDSDENLGRSTIGLAGAAAGSNLLAVNLTLTASASTPLGTYTIQPTGGGASSVSDTAFNDYDMSGASFTLVVGQTLTVARSGGGTGTVTADSGAINCGATCSDIYPGTVVNLTATPDAGSVFVGWTGACTGTGPCAVTVDAAKTVNAQFELAPTFSVTVTKAGLGNGTVTSSPSGISCGATCSSAFAQNAVVTLTATPASGSVFIGWSGEGCSGTGTCVVTVDAAKTVNAQFDLAPTFSVSVGLSGSGSGTVTSTPAGISCGATCSASFASGTVVTLTATPASGSTFTGWTGSGCSGTGTCVVTVTGALSVSAAFAAVTPPPTAVVPVPTLGETALLLLMLLVAGFAVRDLRRRR